MRRFLTMLLLMVVQGRKLHDSVVTHSSSSCDLRVDAETQTLRAELREITATIAALRRELARCCGVSASESLSIDDGRHATNFDTQDVAVTMAKRAATFLEPGGPSIIVGDQNSIISVYNFTQLADELKRAPRDGVTEVTIRIANDLHFDHQLAVSFGQTVHFVGALNRPAALDGQKKTHLISVDAGARASFRLLHFRNGQDNANLGGALYVAGLVTTIEACAFSDNAARFFYGGAIQVEKGTIREIRACNFTKNLAGRYDPPSNGYGGAIYIIEGTIEKIEKTIFADNVAGPYGGNGGAIKNSGSIKTIESCVFRNNSAESISGGNDIDDLGVGGLLLIRNSVFDSKTPYKISFQSVNTFLVNNTNVNASTFVTNTCAATLSCMAGFYADPNINLSKLLFLPSHDVAAWRDVICAPCPVASQKRHTAGRGEGVWPYLNKVRVGY